MYTCKTHILRQRLQRDKGKTSIFREESYLQVSFFYEHSCSYDKLVYITEIHNQVYYIYHAVLIFKGPSRLLHSYTLQCKTSQGQRTKQAWAPGAGVALLGWYSLPSSQYEANVPSKHKMKFLITRTVNSVYYWVKSRRILVPVLEAIQWDTVSNKQKPNKWTKFLKLQYKMCLWIYR